MQKKYKTAIAERYRKSMEKDTSLHAEMSSGTEKVRKKYGESTGEADRYPKTMEEYGKYGTSTEKVRQKYGKCVEICHRASEARSGVLESPLAFLILISDF